MLRDCSFAGKQMVQGDGLYIYSILRITDSLQDGAERSVQYVRYGLFLQKNFVWMIPELYSTLVKLKVKFPR